MATCYLALDAGTTSCRTLVFSQDGRLAGMAQKELTQYFPQPGWVEHDPEEILDCQFSTLKEAIRSAGVEASHIAAAGITNQRETVVAWDGRTGRSLHKAIVWQDRRTVEICNALKSEGLEPYIRENTGLVADAYFSATKMHWLLHHAGAVSEAANRNTLRFGTVDAWLLWHLTRGQVYATDISNAARTLLFNLHTKDWDDVLLRRLGMQRAWLPEIIPSIGFSGFIHPDFLGRSIPITGVAGDQQAALFGHGATRPGMVKNTFGTGCFMLMNTGHRPVSSRFGLLTTVAWQKGADVTYALEGSVFIAGAAIQWLRDGLNLIKHAGESEVLARSVNDNGGVYMVPAFAGLGAPYWDMEARGLISGLTRGTTRAHIVRAALESMAYQTWDILDCMQKDAGFPLQDLSVDGGATANSFLMQFLAGLLQIPVKRPAMQEMTAFGAARMAAEGIHQTLPMQDNGLEIFQPAMPASEAQQLLEGWRQAIRRTVKT
ncbi:MAG: glycerol kinase GlpK [Flavobacteriales bacterium]|nr:glycerol kinase GlpK [Flavobacteriales bacterium]